MLKALRQAREDTRPQSNGLPDELSYSASFAKAEKKFNSFVERQPPQDKERLQLGIGSAKAVSDYEISPAKLRYEMYRNFYDADTRTPDIKFAQVDHGGDKSEQVVEQAGLIYAIERQNMKSFAFVTYKVWEDTIKPNLVHTPCHDNPASIFNVNFLSLSETFQYDEEMLEWIKNNVLLKLPVTNLSAYCQFPQLEKDDLGHFTKYLAPFCKESKIQIYIKSSEAANQNSKRLFGSSKFLSDLRKPGFFKQFEPNERARANILLFTMYICTGVSERGKKWDISREDNVAAFNQLYETYIKDENQSNFNKITTFVEQIITLAKSPLQTKRDQAAEELQKLKRFYECRRTGGTNIKTCLVRLTSGSRGKISKKFHTASKENLKCDNYEKYYTTGSKLGLTQGASSKKKIIVRKRDRMTGAVTSTKEFFACKSRSKGGAKVLLSKHSGSNFASVITNRYLASIMNERVNAFMKENNLFRAKDGKIMHKLASTFTLLSTESKAKLYKFVRQKMLVGSPLNDLSDFGEFFLANEADIGPQIPLMTTLSEESFNLDQATANTLQNLQLKSSGQQVPVLNPAPVIRQLQVPRAAAPQVPVPVPVPAAPQVQVPLPAAPQVQFTGTAVPQVQVPD
jgi:hypothetical protein